MEDFNIITTRIKFEVRNKLVSVFEQLLFLVNTLEQNDKKKSNTKTEDVNSKLKSALNELILRLFEISDEHNYYWHNCSLETYKAFYFENKEYLIKTFGKKRFYRYLENELNSFLEIKKDNIPSNKLNVPNKFIQDIFILIDYTKHLDEYNTFLIEDNNLQKITFLRSEIEKDGYDVSFYQSFFKITKIVNRTSSGSTSDFANNIKNDYVIQNMNVFNIDDKSFPVEALNNLMNNFQSLVAQNQAFQEYPEQNLSKKGLPKFNIQTRFELFKKIGMLAQVEDIKSPTEKGKTIILGSIMDISADNARHLYSKTYKHTFSIKDEVKLNDFLNKEGIKL